MFVNTTHRSEAIEIMDDFSMEGELLGNTLDQIAAINKWLGGNKITLDAVKKIMKPIPADRELTIVDLGCGSGDMLRVVADYARKIDRSVKLIGIDANEFTINYAKDQSKEYPEISYFCDTVPSEVFSKMEYDIVLSTLFLHHFSDTAIKELLGEVTKKAKLGIIVNDLQRSGLAYFLFKLISIFISSPMAREDGLTSILRGFKRKELQLYSDQLGLKGSIQWRWAFRYQWVIKNNSK